jgi:hypothetical protein
MSTVTPLRPPPPQESGSRPWWQRVRPAEAGVGAYCLVALLAGSLAGAGPGLVLLLVLVLRRRWKADRDGQRADPRDQRLARSVLGAAVVLREGVARLLLVGLVVAAVALALLGAGALVAIQTAHGAALLAGIGTAIGVGVQQRRQEAR